MSRTAQASAWKALCKGHPGTDGTTKPALPEACHDMQGGQNESVHQEHASGGVAMVAAAEGK